jgi:excisionase family DNA binding protein
MNQKLLYRVREVAEFLSLSRSKTYELIRSGAIRGVRVDGSLRVRGVDVQAYVDSLSGVA